MSGARLAILYGYVPCQLGLCGPEDSKKRKVISRYLKGEKKLESEIRKILKEFKGAYPYYQLIARSNKIKNPLYVKVVEAYWIGNELLDKVKTADFKKMILNSFVPLGKISRKKADDLSKNSLAYHNFHVLFLGSVTGRAKLEGKLLDVCRVSWGRVKNISRETLTVEYKPIVIRRKPTLAGSVSKKIKWNKNILPKVKTGDWVSIHWNTAIQILGAKEITDIEKYTNRILR